MGVKYRIRLFEKKVLKGLFGSEREEVREGRRKPCNEDLHGF
jgi:hypothetical protein